MNWQASLFNTAFNEGQLPPAKGPEVAFVGRSNVGKSSLINKLINQRLAHVSSKPGKTRSINFYSVKAPTPFVLVDLPGFGYAGRSKTERNSWAQLISHYLFHRQELRLIVHLVDLRHGLVAADRAYQEWAAELSAPTLVCFTKADKVPVTRRKALAFSYIKQGMRSWDVPLLCSINDERSIEALRERIQTFLREGLGGDSSDHKGGTE